MTGRDDTPGVALRARPPARHRRRRRHRARLDDRRGGLLGLRAGRAAAGSGLLIGLALAAVVAYCNATASAQLAAQYPTSGGTYVYGRERLGDWWGFLAGWGFVVGKTASCAAMALTFAAYVGPRPMGQRAVGVVAVVVLTARQPPRHHAHRAACRASLVAGSLLALAVVRCVASSAAGTRLRTRPARRAGGAVRGPAGGRAALLRVRRLRAHRDARRGGPRPARTIPRAIPLALGITVVVYAAVARRAARRGPGRLAARHAPLAAR